MGKILRKPKTTKVSEAYIAPSEAEVTKQILNDADYLMLLQQQASVKAQLKILRDTEEKNKALLDAYVDDADNKNVIVDSKKNRYFRFTGAAGEIFYYKREHRQSTVLKEEETKKILTRKKLLSKVLKKEVKETFDEKAISDLFAAKQLTPDDIKEMYEVVSKGFSSKVITEKQKEEEENFVAPEEAAPSTKKGGRKKKEAPEEMPLIEQETTPTRREKGRGRSKG